MLAGAHTGRVATCVGRTAGKCRLAKPGPVLKDGAQSARQRAFDQVAQTIDGARVLLHLRQQPKANL